MKWWAQDCRGQNSKGNPPENQQVSQISAVRSQDYERITLYNEGVV